MSQSDEELPKFWAVNESELFNTRAEMARLGIPSDAIKIVVERKDYEELQRRLDETEMHVGKHECNIVQVTKERDAALERVRELEEALDFYSHPVRYHTHHSMGYGLNKSEDRMSQMDMDSGAVARKALEGK